MTNSFSTTPQVKVIKSHSGWQIVDLAELKEYRDLLFFLVWRNIKILYAQTILGFAWAIMNPVLQIVIFTLVFGKVAKVSTEGFPYILFSTVAIIPWTYISQSLTQASQSLVMGQQMLDKVYFPRVLFPLTPVFAKLLDFVISLIIVLGVLLYYQVRPTWNLLALPLFLIMMVCIPMGLGFWLSALAIRYRDVKFAMEFIIRMLMYSAPVVYSASSMKPMNRLIYSINPIVGVIEGIRASLLGTAIPWQYVYPGIITTIILLLGGAIYFKRLERVFADVI